ATHARGTGWTKSAQLKSRPPAAQLGSPPPPAPLRPHRPGVKRSLVSDEPLRAPRGRLVFPRCTEGEPRELRLLLLGDYAADPRPLASRAPIRVDEDNLAKVMAELGSTLSLTARDTLSGAEGGELAVRLQVRRVGDFDPGVIVKRVPSLAERLRVREALT